METGILGRMAIAACAALVLAGCATSGPNQAGGAVLGAAAGGLIGSMFGGGSGRLVGTGIGAAFGTAVGSGIGASLDRQADMPPQVPLRLASPGERDAYERGRADREAQIQAQREQRAYEKGYRGY
jgi:hypothetical protein